MSVKIEVFKMQQEKQSTIYKNEAIILQAGV